MSNIESWAKASGEYVLDEAITKIREQWRQGKQIVVLVGAGISVQSGFPALRQLGIHLLRLDALKNHTMRLPRPVTNLAAEPQAEADVYSLLRDGWSSPFVFSELYGVNAYQAVERLLNKRLEPALKAPQSDIRGITEFAQNSLGLSWLTLLDRVAENDPRLIELLIDSLGTHVVPGAAHNLLSHFVSWFNVRLILTTNFDSLIENSLHAEGLAPYVFDIHVNAPPPDEMMLQPHLSVVKLHGSHYGIRADRTINTPLDRGHLATMAAYFDSDALLLVLDYGGSDKRLMGLIESLMDKNNVKVSGETNARKIVRVDAIATGVGSPFYELTRALRYPDTKIQPDDSDARRIYNIYYPHSRLFLLDVLQKCSGKLPNAAMGYAAVPQTPAPFKDQYMFGQEPEYDRKRDTVPIPRKPELLVELLNETRLAVVVGAPGAGVSQQLAVIAEQKYRSHDTIWCDVDEAASVGTVVSWLYGFAVSRQPELPNVPLPLELPVFDPATAADNLGCVSLLKTARALWNRLKRDQYLIVIDSVSYGVIQLLSLGDTTNRLERKACRLILFLAMLCRCAQAEASNSQCILLIGTHTLTPEDQDLVDSKHVLENCLKALEDATPDLAAEAAPIKEHVHLLMHQDTTRPIQRLRHRIEDADTPTVYLWPPSTGARSLDHEVIAADAILPALKGAGEHPTLMDVSAVGDAGEPPAGVGAHPAARSGFSAGDLMKELDVIGTKGLLLCMRRFLYEAALGSRPRSWCQLIALPSVEALASSPEWLGEIPPDTRLDSAAPPDRLTLALRWLIGASKECGLLRPLPGAFYYMDGTLRQLLRNHGKNWKLEYVGVTGKIVLDGPRRVHEKMLRYYERAYNVSGDITALNYFYYHVHQLVELTRSQPQDCRVYLDELTRGLLENTKKSRKHLNVYDHAYLLLRTLDLMETIAQQPEMAHRKEWIIETLADLYEDAQDFANVRSIAGSTKHKRLLGPCFSVYSTCVDGAALLGFGDPASNGAVRSGEAGSSEQSMDAAGGQPHQTARPPEEEKSLAIAALERIGHAFGTAETRLSWLNRIKTENGERNALDTILRLARIVTRNRYYSKLGDESMVRNLLSVGKQLLAGTGRVEQVDTKIAWSRLHTASAYFYLYSSTQQSYKVDDFSQVYRSLSIAKSYAIRAGGIEGSSQQAVASVHFAEALVWEGRLLMLDMSQNRAAEARQKSALRELAESETLLASSRLALVWWREITILKCMATNDIIKGFMGGKNPGDTRPDSLAEMARLLKATARDVCFMRPVVWNDPWHEARLSLELLRAVFYGTGMFLYAYVNFLRPASSDMDQRKLTAVCNDILASLRLIGGSESIIPLLPIHFDSERVAGRRSVDWLADLCCGVRELTSSMVTAIEKHIVDLHKKTPGTVTEPCDKMKRDADQIREFIELTPKLQTSLKRLEEQIDSQVMSWSKICDTPFDVGALGYAGI